MNRAEAIDILFGCIEAHSEEENEALDMAAEALNREQPDEWCTDCKEYDTEKNCCPRFNRVIREALKREPSEDGTLEVEVKDATKIGRVLISDDKHRGGIYYPDEDEPQGISFENDTEIKSCSKDSDLISRAEAIEALGEEPPVWCDEEYEIAERNQWRDDVEAIKSVPSADRPIVIKCKPFLSEEDFKAFAEQVSDQNVILIPYEAEVVSTNTSTKSTNISTKSTNISTNPSADRPRGEWIETAQDYYETVNKKGGGVNENTEYFTDDIACSECLTKFSNIDNETERFNFCPNCGADMRETKGAE